MVPFGTHLPSNSLMHLYNAKETQHKLIVFIKYCFNVRILITFGELQIQIQFPPRRKEHLQAQQIINYSKLKS